MRPDETTRLLPVTEPSGPVVPGGSRTRHGGASSGGAASGGAASGGAASGGAASGVGRVPVRPRVLAVVVALLGAGITVFMWRVFVTTRLGQVVEEIAYDGALYGRNRLWTVAEPLLDVVSVSFVVLGTVVSVGVALLRRRWSLAMQVAVVVVGSNVTTQVLKYYVFDRVNLGGESWWDNSLPSGHTTVAASVSVALVLAVPRVARPLVALLGATYTAATGISTLVGQWHRPSDVVAALAVVLMWGALACALTTPSALDPVPAADARRNRYAPRGSRTGTGWALAVLVVGAVGGGVAAVWALRHTIAVVESSAEVTGRAEVIGYLGGASAVVAATAVVFALLLALRQAVARAAAAVPV